MKWGCYWTTATSAFQRYHPSILIQPSSPCRLLPSQVMELFSEPQRSWLGVLCWKARVYTHVGQAIEFWMCGQRYVCVRGLTWFVSCPS